MSCSSGGRINQMGQRERKLNKMHQHDDFAEVGEAMAPKWLVSKGAPMYNRPSSSVY